MESPTLKNILILAVVIFLVDIPWLSFVSGSYSDIIQTIQGGQPARMRALPGAVVYLALAFLALRTTSYKDAFLVGASVYAVYDFTVMALFAKYPLYMAVADTLWGGILFTVVYFVRDRFAILK